MPVILSRIAHRFPRRRALSSAVSRIPSAIMDGFRPTMREKIAEFGNINIPQRILHAVRAIDGAACDNGNITLLDVHTAEYDRLLNCKTLQEAKESFHEFANIKETKGALTLLQSLYCGKNPDDRHVPKVSRRLLEKLNFPKINEKYMNYITRERSARAGSPRLSFMA